MASFYTHMFSSLILLLNFSLSFSLPTSIFLPLSKHPLSNHHLTHLPLQPQTPLLLDLNSPFLSLTSLPTINNVSIIPRLSIPCSASVTPSSLSIHHHNCLIPLTNSLTKLTTLAHLLKAYFYNINDFFFLLSPAFLTGLPSSVKGVFGLGRNRLGIPQQFTHSFHLSNTFSICLSSSFSNNGFVLFGQNHFNSMLYTPMTDSYRIILKSIKIRNNKITLSKPSSVQISTTTPYTLVKTDIYKEIITAFATVTDTLGMIRATSIGGFELCYTMNEIDVKKVPVIDLVLQSEMVKWSIHGHNSMVRIDRDVTCLGILDGGDELEDVIVLGTHQLEDNLIEFDLERSMIGFSSSLLVKQSSCSSLLDIGG